jgi:hypothetical protein
MEKVSNISVPEDAHGLSAFEFREGTILREPLASAVSVPI